MRASMGTLFALESMAAIPFTISLIVAFKNPRAGAGLVAKIIFLVMCLAAVWVRCFLLKISDGVLVYRTLFGGTKRVKIADIEEASFETGGSGFANRLRPMVRLAVRPQKTAGLPPFDINLKVFSRRDIQELLGVLSNSYHLKIG